MRGCDGYTTLSSSLDIVRALARQLLYAFGDKYSDAAPVLGEELCSAYKTISLELKSKINMHTLVTFKVIKLERTE